ncbi:hypothetical protein EK21DRAFT_108775 [Setomelanomma holmii]|uniref:Uncharacterized protein n=1 Tax=Setomelanomma holmii TaxID=210430 RepID=A0A9P4LQW4_9PLEO|nr:hypothetical protein EK21DRAFT_108775 [Setomelanomma holmii]
MDPSKNKARQTNIIDDFEAIALAQQGQRKKPQKKKKAVTFQPHSPHNLSRRTQAKPIPKKRFEVSKLAVAPGVASNTKTTSAAIMAHERQEYFDGDGIRVPLYDIDGRNRPYARLSSAILLRNRDQLLDIVEDYAGADKRKQIEAEERDKKYIADWIEQAETIAMGPNPDSKLGQDSSDEDEVAPVTSSKVKLASQQSAGHAPSKRKRPRRKYIPTPYSPQTTKKQKSQPAEEQLPQQSKVAHIEDNLHAEHRVLQVSNAKRTFLDQINAEREANLFAFMNDVQLYPDVQETSETSRVVQIPENREDRVLTASWQRKPIEGSHALRPTLHDTPIAHNPRDRKPPKPHNQPPFLNEGTHGRHGNCGIDQNRRTGRGHQLSRENEVTYAKYLDVRGKILQHYPTYPKIKPGEEVNQDTRDAWNDMERYFTSFRAKYPGNQVNHLWPCGCEKLRFGSEEEESEEE